MRRSSAGVTLGIAAILLAAVWSATSAAAESVPSPTLSGPIPVNAPPGGHPRDHVHFTPEFELADHGEVDGADCGAVLRVVHDDDLKDRYVTLAAAIETIAEDGLSEVPPEELGRSRSPETP